MNRLLASLGTHRRLIFLVIAAFAVGFLVRGRRATERPSASPEDAAAHDRETATIWTCSMHPQIRLPKSGKCPICFMDLIPVSSAADASDEGPRVLTLSPAAVALASVETTPAERKYVSREVRMVGKVTVDETRLAYISAWVPGRIDELFVDYTGIPVRKGDHLASLYSPELYAAQVELIQAVKTAKNSEGGTLESAEKSAQRNLAAARDRLRLWGIPSAQIEEIENRGTPDDHMTIYAPIGGIVIEKMGFKGMYVQPDTRIYTVADLSRLWIKLDAYESDLEWIRYGQKAEFEVEAYPGEIFQGRIAFIDPVLNPATRTAKVRVNVDNSNGRLKPEMFVRAVIKPRLAADNNVVDPSLAGKWICPMHPDVVKDEEGSCDLCGMPLETAESLGYAGAATDQPPLVIPDTAPLLTGKRAVVYVADPGKPGTYEGREILLGAHAGDEYIVADGLREGELVVTRGNFRIDSELQIRAKVSMMNPEDDLTTAAPEMPTPPTPGAFQSQLNDLYARYLEIQAALAADDLEKARSASESAGNALKAVDMELLAGEPHRTWMEQERGISNALDRMIAAQDIQTFREGFFALSESLSSAVRLFGVGPAEPVFLLRCPMAFNNRGATWLQADKDTRNPYFGNAMLQCGSVIDVLQPGADGGRHGGRDHE